MIGALGASARFQLTQLRLREIRGQAELAQITTGAGDLCWSDSDSFLHVTSVGVLATWDRQYDTDFDLYQT